MPRPDLIPLAGTKRLPFVWAHDATPDLEGNWLIKDLLPAEVPAVMHGHPGCGKTFLATDLGLHIAAGRPWNGLSVEGGLVAYVAAEGGRGIKRRLTAWRKHHDLNDPIPFALLPEALSIWGDKNDVNPLIETVLELSAEAEKQPRLIVLDTLSKTFGGKENSDDLASYVANCQRIASATGATVLIIHHRPKDSESSDPRGHSSLKGGVDTVLLVEQGGPKRVTVVKQKDGEEGFRVHFDLRPIEIGRDKNDDPVNSCVVEIVQAQTAPIDPRARAVSRLGPKQTLARNAIQKLIESDGIPIPSEIPDSEINRVMVCRVLPFKLVPDNLQNSLRTSPDDNPDNLRRSASRAIQDLKTKDLLGTWGDWLWLKY